MFLRILGKTFIATGVLILLFLGYQLVGTNLITKRHQQTLAAGLNTEYASQPADGDVTTLPKPDVGDGVARIEIPNIEVDWVVVEGVTVEALKKGPGHMPGTAFPGETGNVVISGHRTTYGAPFYRLDELRVGDLIVVSTAENEYTYKVSESKIVLPTDIAVAGPTDDARLTLTTCHPRFSAAKRLIIVAELMRSKPLVDAA